MKEQILRLREEGHSYRSIQNQLGCAKSTVSYHCGEGQKEKNLARTRAFRTNMSPLKRMMEIKTASFYQKVDRFKDREQIPRGLTTKEAVEVLEAQSYKCYLTGAALDLSSGRKYHFDHKIPVSKGGSSTKENLGICTREANQAKSDMSIDEFMALCRNVIEYNMGYIE